eukprot:UN22420
MRAQGDHLGEDDPESTFWNFYVTGLPMQFWYRGDANWPNVVVEMSGNGNSMIVQEVGDHVWEQGDPTYVPRWKNVWYMKGYHGNMWWTNSDGP